MSWHEFDRLTATYWCCTILVNSKLISSGIFPLLYLKNISMEPEIPINSYHSVLEEAFIANLGQDKQQFLHLFANPFLHQLPFAN